MAPMQFGKFHFSSKSIATLDHVTAIGFGKTVDISAIQIASVISVIIFGTVDLPIRYK